MNLNHDDWQANTAPVTALWRKQFNTPWNGNYRSPNKSDVALITLRWFHDVAKDNDLPW